MIPPGIHFIYFSVTDKYGNLGMRNGFFHNFKLKEVLAKKWNQQTETIDNYVYSSEELRGFSENRRELDKFLGPYPFDEYKRWISLAKNLNENFDEIEHFQANYENTLQCLDLNEIFNEIEQMQEIQENTLQCFDSNDSNELDLLINQWQ